MNYPEITKRLIAVRKDIRQNVPKLALIDGIEESLHRFVIFNETDTIEVKDLKPLIPQEEYEQQNTWR